MARWRRRDYYTGKGYDTDGFNEYIKLKEDLLKKYDEKLLIKNDIDKNLIKEQNINLKGERISYRPTRGFRSKAPNMSGSSVPAYNPYPFPHKFNIGEYIRWVDTVEAIDYVVDQYLDSRIGLEHWDGVEGVELKIIDMKQIGTPDGKSVLYIAHNDQTGMDEKIPEKFAEFVF